MYYGGDLFVKVSASLLKAFGYGSVKTFGWRWWVFGLLLSLMAQCKPLFWSPVYCKPYVRNTKLSDIRHMTWDRWHVTSDQRIVIFPANSNMNRFAEPTSLQIGIGIVCEFQDLRIGIGIIFVRWDLFANISRIPKIFFLFIFFLIFFLSVFSYIFHLKNPPGKKSYSKTSAYSLYIYSILG